MRKINIPKDLLLELYVDKNLTTYQIADELGVNRQTISNKLKDYGIELRDTRFKKTPKKKTLKAVVKKEYEDKDIFESKYKELKAIDLVADYFNINVKTAYQWKKKHGIATIKQMSARGRDRINGDKPWCDKTTLEDMYNQFSTYDLAKMWNCHPSTISKWLKKHNIPTKTISEQWDIKSKGGGARVLKSNGFDLQEYNRTYTQTGRLSKKVVESIKNLVGKCQSCGEKDVLDLHHINGNPEDNRPCNHVILCPNCHARIHRLNKTVEELCPDFISWDTLLSSDTHTLKRSKIGGY